MNYKVTKIAEKQYNWEDNLRCFEHSITDGLGFKTTLYNNKATIKSIEAKANYEDFKNGFCVAGEYNYLIAQKGVIPKNEVPSFVGLIEVDFDKFHYNGRDIRGYESVKRASRIELPQQFKQKELSKMKWRMLYKLTEDKFKDHWLVNTDIREKYKDRFNSGVMRNYQEG